MHRRFEAVRVFLVGQEVAADSVLPELLTESRRLIKENAELFDKVLRL